jgi:hypothetical protein
MPTFDNPLSDAAEASEALRGLAHATRTFDNPADTYAVIGDLLSGVRSLRQVFDQLATTHLTHQDRAFNDAGDHKIGAGDALAASDELHQAGSLLDAAIDRLDAASQASGRIAWHPAHPVVESVQRYVSVVFLQGEDADRVLDQIDADGITAGIQHLQGWDYGNETTDTALADGHVFDTVPSGALDWSAEHGDYVLIANRHLGHVSLLRKTFLDTDAINKADGVDADIAPARPDDPPARHAPSAPSVREDAFAHPFRPAHISAVVRDRGVGL